MNFISVGLIRGIFSSFFPLSVTQSKKNKMTRRKRRAKKSDSKKDLLTLTNEYLLTTDKYDVIRGWERIKAEIGRMNLDDLEENFVIYLEGWPRVSLPGGFQGPYNDQQIFIISHGETISRSS
jgi:hypothetical protein